MCGLRVPSKLAPRSLDKQRPCLPVHKGLCSPSRPGDPGGRQPWEGGGQAGGRHRPAGPRERGPDSRVMTGLPPARLALPPRGSAVRRGAARGPHRTFHRQRELTLKTATSAGASPPGARCPGLSPTWREPLGVGAWVRGCVGACWRGGGVGCWLRDPLGSVRRGRSLPRKTKDPCSSPPTREAVAGGLGFRRGRLSTAARGR